MGLINDTQDELRSSKQLSFQIIESNSDNGARLGRIHRKGHTTIETPNFIAPTSRGIVPHLAPDVLAEHVKLSGVYIALEDFIERAPSQGSAVFLQPVSADDDSSRLADFAALPSEHLLVLGARRTPPLECPTTNADEAVAVCTSDGFQQMSTAYYASAAVRLQPDVVVALGDVLFPLNLKPGRRRREKMAGRSERWVKELINFFAADVELAGSEHVRRPAIFAPVLPLELEQQQWYIDFLTSPDILPQLAGLAVYSADAGATLPQPLAHLARLSLSEPQSPHEILRAILVGGGDVFAVPFAGKATEAGVALTFDFPAPSPTLLTEQTPEPPSMQGTPKLPLGLSCSDPAHATSLKPLKPACSCYACTTHHRAYLHHLLSAKEMLAWVLLQIHNIAVLDRFFAGIRTSIAAGPDVFAADVRRFEDVYEADMFLGLEDAEAQTGVRLRGYQRRSTGGATGVGTQVRAKKGDGRLNKPAWTASLGSGASGPGPELTDTAE